MQFKKVCAWATAHKPIFHIWEFYETGKNGGVKMIEITKLNGTVLLINAELIECVEETPDTVITLTTGRKLIVKESRQDVKNLVKSYRREIFAIHNAE